MFLTKIVRSGMVLEHRTGHWWANYYWVNTALQLFKWHHQSLWWQFVDRLYYNQLNWICSVLCEHWNNLVSGATSSRNQVYNWGNEWLESLFCIQDCQLFVDIIWSDFNWLQTDFCEGRILGKKLNWIGNLAFCTELGCKGLALFLAFSCKAPPSWWGYVWSHLIRS